MCQPPNFSRKKKTHTKKWPGVCGRRPWGRWWKIFWCWWWTKPLIPKHGEIWCQRRIAKICWRRKTANKRNSRHSNTERINIFLVEDFKHLLVKQIGWDVERYFDDSSRKSELLYRRFLWSLDSFECPAWVMIYVWSALTTTQKPNLLGVELPSFDTQVAQVLVQVAIPLVFLNQSTAEPQPTMIHQIR